MKEEKRRGGSSETGLHLLCSYQPAYGIPQCQHNIRGGHPGCTGYEDTDFRIPGYGLLTSTSAMISNALGEGDRNKFETIAGLSVIVMISRMLLNGVLIQLMVGKLAIPSLAGKNHFCYPIPMKVASDGQEVVFLFP